MQIISLKTEITSESRVINLIIFGLPEDGETAGNTIQTLPKTLDECGLRCELSGLAVTMLGHKRDLSVKPGLLSYLDIL